MRTTSDVSSGVASAVPRQVLEAVRCALPLPEARCPKVRGLIQHIHARLFEPDLNVKLLKAACHIHDNNISSHFRFMMGVSIKQYIETLRMQSAGRLLRESSLPIFDVARLLGYDHLQTFYSAFRRQFGCTPAAYREQAPEQEAPAPEELPPVRQRVG